MAVTGSTISHYRILDKLGEGGMGVVYKAEDTKLQRTVALKFFPVAVDPARLLREARLAASLHHPNVCTVFEVDEEHRFIAMEFIEGRTLKDVIGGRPLRVAQAVDFAIQIGEGLRAAHRQGIVHRDVKSSNVLVTSGGQAKVTDFGLARAGQAGLTKEGAVGGTPGYMAPEQAAGGEVDERSDIWGFGAVLHEMIAGRIPAAGDVDPMPAELDRIVRKALATNPGERYQHMDDFLVDLRRVRAPERPGSRRRFVLAGGVSVAAVGGIAVAWRLTRGNQRVIRSIAVLPLRNLSRDAEQEFFSDAVTEALITSLSQIRSLKVISRTSAMRFKGANKSLAEIASELGVDAVVDGSVQRSKQRVRISAQLIHASTDTNLWARDYDRDVSDVLLLQSEVARAIADEIRATVTSAERARLAHAQSRNPEAQDAYLLGRYHFWRMNERDLAEATRQFERAVQFDPQFAAAWAGLSDAWRERGIWGALPFQEVLPKARAAALRSLEIDPNLSAAHCSVAFLQSSYDWDWAAAQREYRSAIDLDPNNLDAHWGYAVLLMTLGRFPESIAEMDRCVALDPLSTTILSTYGRILYRARKYPEAKVRCERAIELDPGDFGAYSRLADAYEQMGDYPRALEAQRKALQVRGREESGSAAIARINALAGRPDEARRILGAVTNPQPQAMALACFALGDKNTGFKWLEKAFDRRDLVIFIKYEPKFDSVRDDPRFQALVKRLNIPD